MPEVARVDDRCEDADVAVNGVELADLDRNLLDVSVFRGVDDHVQVQFSFQVRVVSIVDFIRVFLFLRELDLVKKIGSFLELCFLMVVDEGN